jgi:hypothetical protein
MHVWVRPKPHTCRECEPRFSLSPHIFSTQWTVHISLFCVVNAYSSRFNCVHGAGIMTSLLLHIQAYCCFVCNGVVMWDNCYLWMCHNLYLYCLICVSCLVLWHDCLLIMNYVIWQVSHSESLAEPMDQWDVNVNINVMYCNVCSAILFLFLTHSTFY